MRLTLVNATALFLHVRDILNDEKIGTPRLIYVKMEDGPMFRADWQNWKSRSGAALQHPSTRSGLPMTALANDNG